jgi:hypothetical protein
VSPSAPLPEPPGTASTPSAPADPPIETPAVRLTLEPYSGPRSARAVVAFASATQRTPPRRLRAQQLGLALLVAGLLLLVAGALARLGVLPLAPSSSGSASPR